MKHRILIIIFFLSGCSMPYMAQQERSAVKAIVKANEIHATSMNMLMNTDEKWLDVLPYWVSLVKGLLGDDARSLRQETARLLKELDLLSVQTIKAMDGKQRGLIRGKVHRLEVKLALDVGKEIVVLAVRELAPLLQ